MADMNLIFALCFTVDCLEMKTNMEGLRGKDAKIVFDNFFIAR